MKTAEEYEATIAYLTDALEKVKVMCDEGAAQLRDFERSAASAREIARVAMSHTGTRVIRASVESTSTGISVIVCDPAGNETETARKIAKFLDAALWAQCGLGVSDEPGKPIGSSA
jgi:hypothetical protein